MVNLFLRRPVLATVCSLLIILAGATAIPTLPISQFPSLAPPTVTVSAFYNGANSQTVETSVTNLIEEAVNGAPGMRYITSNSGNDGSSAITATFDLDRDLDIAAVDVQNRASSALGRLPAEVQQTGVQVGKNSGGFVLAAGFYSPDKRYDALFISNYLDIYVKNALKRVKGVGDVLIFGERKFATRIWLQPEKLAKRGMTPADVIAALREQNVQVPAGAIGQPPSGNQQMYEISVRAEGRFTDPKQFDTLVIKRTADGSLIQLRDVARVELGAESYGSNLAYNGYEAIGLGVTQLSNANALDVDKAVREELAKLAPKLPPGLKFQVAFDTTTAVSSSISEVLKTLAMAIAIVILVIYLFLQGWRSTVIPAITIPVSLVGTFAFIKLFGFSINTLTLFGITLATGLVVDDAIVVIENVERHLEEGANDAYHAARVAMAEVTGAVIATSLVLIAVFLPVSLFPGTTGRMYQQFALTIAFSIAISAFNALTLTPALAGLLLKRGGHAKTGFFGAVNRGLHRTTTSYSRTLNWLEDHKFAVVIVFVLGLAAAYGLYRTVPTSFVPNEDEGYFIVLVQAPEGASLEYTSEVCDRVTKTLLQNPDIVGVFSVPGFAFGGSAPNRGLVFINLKDIDRRHGSQHTGEGIVESVRMPLMMTKGALVIPFLPPPIEGLGTYGGFQFELQQTGAGSLADLDQTLHTFIGKASQKKELRGLFSSFSARDPQYLVNIDREKAKSMGVQFNDIASTLQIFLGSQYVNDFDFNNRSYRVYVQADQPYRMNAQDIHQFYVRGDKNAMVPLDAVVSVKEMATSANVAHYNMFRSAEIDGNSAPGYSSGQAIAAMEAAAHESLPVGYSFEWTGLSREEIESGSQKLVLFALGLLVVYLTLAAQYESFVLPFVILLAVPMAVVGALGAQYIRGLQDDVYCQVGLVMLIGLASKNAILIVEFAEQLRGHGRTLIEAVVEAARLRLRPILMTSIAFILGVLPLVFATGSGSAGRHSVGTTVFGGMIVSTVLNLFVIPVLYVIVRTALPGKVRESSPLAEEQHPA